MTEIAWDSAEVGYAFSIAGKTLVRRKTTDGGKTWSESVALFDGVDAFNVTWFNDKFILEVFRTNPAPEN